MPSPYKCRQFVCPHIVAMEKIRTTLQQLIDDTVCNFRGQGSSVFIMCQDCQAITNQRYVPPIVISDKQNSERGGCL